MKKFFKFLFTFLLIIILISTIGYFAFRRKINIYRNIASKAISYSNNPELLTNPASLTTNESMDYKDVVYKSDASGSKTLDIYGPIGEKKPSSSPVIIYVHGGSWIYGNKDIPNALCPLLDSFREEGYTIISTSYTLLDENSVGSFEAPASDVKDTIRWVHKNSSTYNLDVDNIGVIGVSSGAHLSLLAGYSDSNEFIGDSSLSSYPSTVKYIIDLFGPTDLSTLNINDAYGPLKTIIETSSDINSVYDKYSPINYVHKNVPETLIVHSKNDKLVPYENSQLLYDKLLEYKTEPEILTLTKSGHDLDALDKSEITSVSLEVLKFVVGNAPLF